MKTSFISGTFISLCTVLMIGCGGNTTETLVTKSLLSTDNSQLIIHIDPNDAQYQQEVAQEEGEETPHENQAPVAVVKGNGEQKYLDIHIGEPVFFDSSESSDPDGQITKYVWTDMDYNVLSTDVNFTRTFYKAGIYEKTLTIADDQGAISHDRICILADITAEQIPMIANAGPDMVVPENFRVTLAGRVICIEGDYSYEWKENNELLSQEATFQKMFDAGIHEVMLKITDNETGHMAYDTITITVTPADE